MIRSRLLIPVVAAAAAVLAMAPVIGEAQTADVIAFTGHAVINGNTGVACTGNFVCLQGGSGTFNFNSTVCAGASTDAAEAGLCAIAVVNGAFQNIACGTGAAQGNAAIAGADAGTAAFNITFVATIGFVTVNGGIVAPFGGAGAGTGDFAGDNGNGAVLISGDPTAAGSALANQCVGAFFVTGAIVAEGTT